MEAQAARIRSKLETLRQTDAGCILFGANTHRYLLNPPLAQEEIRAFESRFGITLPEAYTLFLEQLGNGGAGPFYGLEPLENALFDDLDYRREYFLDPSKPFRHTAPWNLEFSPTVSEEDEVEYEKQFEAFTEVYYSTSQRDGAIAICNYGCGIALNLVVNGPEYGHIWTDDRGNDGGIYPSMELGNKDRITFLDWYELWLDSSMTEIQEKLKNKNGTAH